MSNLNPSMHTDTTTHSEQPRHKNSRPRKNSRLQRWAVRLFFIGFATALAIDTAPSGVGPAPRVKALVWPLLTRLGLWQGQWTLFAPNPKINNTWLSAEIYRPDGSQQELWNSTYWADTSSWERFSGFRHINYNNRIQTQGQEAANDLADYLARQLISPTARPITPADPASSPEDAEADSRDHSFHSTVAVPDQSRWRMVLSRNELNICLPDDGSLPTRDETVWLSSSRNLAVREYQP